MKIISLLALSILGSLDNGSDSLSALDENAPREYWLAIAYANGIRVEKNMQIAAVYFEKAARMGHGPSQRNLGIMSGMGDGIKKDIPLAYAWLSIATVNKDPVAPKALKDLVQGMSAQQIDRGEKKSLSMLNELLNIKEKLQRHDLSHPRR